MNIRFAIHLEIVLYLLLYAVKSVQDFNNMLHILFLLNIVI